MATRRTRSGTRSISKVKPRKNALDWKDYFMAVAFLSAQRSKDPITQVGACIVNPDKRIVGTGYNGMPNGCSDDKLPWGKGKGLNHKKFYVCHAEHNAILNKNSANIKGCTIYVSLFPCNECAKLIIQSGIKEVLYVSDKHYNKLTTKASKRLLKMAKVKYKQYTPKKKKIEIDFSSIEQ